MKYPSNKTSGIFFGSMIVSSSEKENVSSLYFFNDIAFPSFKDNKF